MNDIHIKWLSLGKLALANDRNLPTRAEEFGSIEIERVGDVPMVKALNSGDVVLDVGAFIGDTAVSFLNRGCIVHAFEPFVDAYLCLVFNTMKEAKEGRMFYYWDAVGDGEPTELVWECNGENQGMRRVRSSGEQCRKSVKLDDFNFQRVDLIKLDCEGSEVLALRGAAETIGRLKPPMFIEMYEDGLKSRGFTPDDLLNEIHSLGYRAEMYGSPPRWDWMCFPNK